VNLKESDMFSQFRELKGSITKLVGDWGSTVEKIKERQGELYGNMLGFGK
jgi:hypothetical protein